jgi:DNA-binding beta-propeller fold protein YncE
MLPTSAPISRRTALQRLARGSAAWATGAALASLGGCVPASVPAPAQPDLVWGRRGLSEGRLMKPRAMVLDAEDNLHIVDMTGRIQIFDPNGNFLRSWRTPEIKQGKPTGLGMAPEGTLLVADTHYFRVLFYDQLGNLDPSRTIGGEHGDAPGQFHFVTDVVQDPRGHFFIGQYGQIDRIQEFDPEGNFLRAWGTQGSQNREFSRPQALLIDDSGLLWVADACNHRIQVFDVHGTGEPELVSVWGEPGSEPGQLQYPYGMDFDVDGSLLIAEFGNHRVQRFSKAGESLQVFGSVGAEPGQFLSPWALAIDSRRNLHVLDTMNHRVQRFRLT